MALTDEIVNNGNWLYRWRSYLPLLMFGLLIAGFPGFTYAAGSETLEDVWEIGCLAISLFGLGIRAHAIGHAPRGTSGRNTDKQEADSLNTTGLYSVVRHPLYLGNFLIWFGISLFIRVWWVTTISVLIFWLYYERIMAAEEYFLKEKFGKAFEDWAAKTPTFLPGRTGWKRPGSPFSMKSVLRREYGGFFAIITIFTALNTAAHFSVEGRFEFDALWTILFFFGLVVYLTLRTLKKKTSVLNPP